MNLQIDDEMYQKLLELAKEYKDQANWGLIPASHWMFTIRHTENVTCLEEFADDYYWEETSSGDCREFGNEKAKAWCKEHNFYFDEDEDELGDGEDCLVKRWYKEAYSFENRGAVNCFFTQKAASVYIENDRHNLGKDPHTYAFIPEKNPEMKLIADFLMALAREEA